MDDWDLVIIGAGAAGLAAGIYGVRSGLKTLVVEEKVAGGTTSDAPLVENYPGFARIEGIELAQKLVSHARQVGAVIHEFETVVSLDATSDVKTIKTNRSTYACKTVILTMGSHYREAGVPGEKEFRGKGVSYCGICDGPLFKGKKVLVLGGGNSALITSLYLSDLASEVKIVHRRDAFRAEEAYARAIKEKKNVEVFWDSELKEIKGEKLVTRAIIIDKKADVTKELLVDGVFVQIGEDPNSQLAKDAGIEVNDCDYVVVDMNQRTNVAGVYAAGDLTNHPVKQIGTAVGMGITAALEAYAFIRRPYYRSK